jgi:hypothetical protein
MTTKPQDHQATVHTCDRMEEQYVWPKTSISDTHLRIGESHH